MPPTTLYRTALAASFLLVGAAAHAQQEPIEKNSTACTHLFNKGSGAAQLSYCVNAHANMMSFIGGSGAEHIRVAPFIDGYAVCSTSHGVHGYDAGDGGESAWGANLMLGTVTSAGVAYARTTFDGRLRIEHTFKMDTAEGDVALTVKVVNLSAATINGIAYKRISDFDAVVSTLNMWTRSLDEVEAVSTTLAPKGISLNASSFGTSHDTSIGSAINLNDCVMPPTAANGAVLDGVAHVRYNLGNLAPGKSKTVKFVYKRK